MREHCDRDDATFPITGQGFVCVFICAQACGCTHTHTHTHIHTYPHILHPTSVFSTERVLLLKPTPHIPYTDRQRERDRKSRRP